MKKLNRLIATASALFVLLAGQAHAGGGTSGIAIIPVGSTAAEVADAIEAVWDVGLTNIDCNAVGGSVVFTGTGGDCAGFAATLFITVTAPGGVTSLPHTIETTVECDSPLRCFLSVDGASAAEVSNGSSLIVAPDFVFGGNHVPTVPQWGLIALMALLGLGAVWILHRRSALPQS